MDRRKSNISAWCLLGLACVLVMGCFLLAMGTAFARYRESTSEDLKLRARVPAQVYLWAGNDPQGDYFPGAGSWVMNNGVQELSFMVTNTDSKDEIPKATQEFRLRMFVSLGAWDGVSEMPVRLTYSDGDKTEIIYAKASAIKPDTPLYGDFGDGWIFTFVDKNEKELRWTLEGGERSTISMQLILENPQIVDTSLLQLQVIGEMTED